MSRTVKIVIALNLVVVTALAFLYAHLMIAPGPVVKGHAEIETDCFACHTVFVGATSPKCIDCHTVKEIGIKTVAGEAIERKPWEKPPVPFHQKLQNNECMACHTDHVGIAVYRQMNKFSHDLLAKEDFRVCETCHAKQAPDDELHRVFDRCKNCHETTHWKPAKKPRSEYTIPTHLLPRTQQPRGPDPGGEADPRFGPAEPVDRFSPFAPVGD